MLTSNISCFSDKNWVRDERGNTKDWSYKDAVGSFAKHKCWEGINGVHSLFCLRRMQYVPLLCPGMYITCQQSKHHGVVEMVTKSQRTVQ